MKTFRQFRQNSSSIQEDVSSSKKSNLQKKQTITYRGYVITYDPLTTSYRVKSKDGEPAGAGQSSISEIKSGIDRIIDYSKYHDGERY